MPTRTTEPFPEGAPTLGEGRYAIVSRIDAGGMASVYRVWDRKLKVARAMKVLLPEYARNQTIYRRFQSEARTMARFEHPHLVRIYDVGHEGGLPFLVMELVTGGTLQRWIEAHGRMPPRLAIEATLQLVDGLSVVHAAGIIHRDIKPHNVLLAESGICKLTDFGIAHLDENGSITKTGATLGTQGYMAPEQRTDAKSVDTRADLYGVGATLWALLSGKAAHDVFVLVERGGLDPFPPYLHDVLRKTVAYSRDARFPDTRALERALRAALAAAPDAEDDVDLPLDDTTEDFPVESIDDEIAAVLRGPPQPSLFSTPLPPDRSGGSGRLPYYMPSVGRKATGGAREADDDDPDWLAKDTTSTESGVGTGPEEIIGAGVPVRAEPTPPEAPPAPPSLPPQPAPASVPPAPVAAEPPKPEPEPAPEADANPVWVWLLSAVVVLLLGALLTLLAAGVVVSRSADGLREAQRSAEAAREEVYLTLTAEEGAVQRLRQAGADTNELEARYLAFRDAKGEPARQEAARGFLDALEAEAARSLGPDAVSPSQVEAAHAVRRILARESGWDDADAAWAAAGAGLTSQVAIRLGLVLPPPEP